MFRWVNRVGAMAVPAAIVIFSALPGLAQTPSSNSWTTAPGNTVRVPVTDIGVGALEMGILDYKDPVVSGQYIQAFRFNANAGTPIQVRVSGSNDNRLPLSPVLLVYGPNGQLIARAEVDTGTIVSYFVDRMPETGSYTVFITGAPEENPGRFAVTVREVADDALSSMSLPLISGTPINPDSTAASEWETTTPQQ